MAFAFSTSTREVLEQVVREPRYRELARIPLFPPAEILLMLAVFSLLYLSTLMYLQGQLPALAMIAINGVLIYASFTPLHDATHRTVSSNRFVNDLLGTISCLPLIPGITTGIYRYLHLEHHRFAGDPLKDPDELFVSTHPALAIFLLPFPDIRWSIWYLRHWSARSNAERLEYCLAIAFYIGVHVVFLTSPYALEFFLCFMIPQRIGLGLVLYFFARIQHPEDVQWESAPFQTTVQIRCNPLSRILMLGQAVHCVHHLLPSVPYYRYHRAWEAGRHLFERQNIPQRGLFLTPPSPALPENVASRRIPVQVTAITPVAQDINAYELQALPGADALPAFTAGAHIDVVLAEGLVRQYSLSNSASDEGRYVIAVKCEHNGRGGSRTLHSTVQAGSQLIISEPRNNFPLNASAGETVLVAGGIGATPILSMAHTLWEAGQLFSLHLCAADETRLPFGESLSELPFADRISVHLGIRDNPQAFSAEAILGNYAQGKELYICGPAAFMASVIEAGRSAGWPDNALFSENFKPRALVATENVAFEVELAHSGKVLQVGEDEFLLDVLNKAKAGIPCSCTQGICGSCVTPVISGDIDHRDAVLSDEEREQGKKMCVCVGRARSGRLVLDI
jgi:ferredoxin-NADP reductase/fatty acid desaturase